MLRECWERFPRHRLQSKSLMHHGTCVTHVTWCMSWSLTRGGGENVPGIPGACATRNFTYLIRGPCTEMTDFGSRHTLEVYISTASFMEMRWVWAKSPIKAILFNWYSLLPINVHFDWYDLYWLIPIYANLRESMENNYTNAVEIIVIHPCVHYRFIHFRTEMHISHQEIQVINQSMMYLHNFLCVP